jgi:hypothetical protein
LDVKQLRHLSDEIRRNTGDDQKEVRRALAQASLEPVQTAVSDVEQVYLAERARRPPRRLRPGLWNVGRLIYEASWALTDDVEAVYESLPKDAADRKKSQEASAKIDQFADAARSLWWPHYSPRSLGAIRSQALAASKRDTPRGYYDARILHDEARDKAELFRESLIGTHSRYATGLDETFLQLALAETGTACRTAERVLGRWAEGLKDDPPAWRSKDEARWIQALFRSLADGALVGEQALAVARTIHKKHGFVKRVTEDRMAMTSAYRNPGVMTARALQLLLPLCTEMEALKRMPPGRHRSWRATQEDIRRRFVRAYRAIERPVRAKGQRGPVAELRPPDRRSVIQLRLNYALLVPGASLPSRLDFDPCLERSILADEAADELSVWLTRSGSESRGTNALATVTMPSYIRAIERCRVSYGATEAFGYTKWRRRWRQLDRYAAEDQREKYVDEALAEARRLTR